MKRNISKNPAVSGCRVSLIGIIAIGAVIVFCLAGCPSGGGGDDDGGLPSNLRNTEWTQAPTPGSRVLAFKTSTIELDYSGKRRTFTVVSAVSNGKIEASEESAKDGLVTETFCESYTITGNTLKLTGKRSFSGDYTKK